MLVKRYVLEAGSKLVAGILAPPSIVGTALITRAEVAASLAKAVRIGAITRMEGSRALDEFRGHWPYLLTFRMNESLVARADELAWDLNLRGYDAVHLATALVWQEAL
ncbi:MAG: type II toxin-antitoxin system VapC family toxin, partial [Anaerolineales bacterium]